MVTGFTKLLGFALTLCGRIKTSVRLSHLRPTRTRRPKTLGLGVKNVKVGLTVFLVFIFPQRRSILVGFHPYPNPGGSHLLPDHFSKLLLINRSSFYGRFVRLQKRKDYSSSHQKWIRHNIKKKRFFCAIFFREQFHCIDYLLCSLPRWYRPTFSKQTCRKSISLLFAASSHQKWINGFFVQSSSESSFIAMTTQSL